MERLYFEFKNVGSGGDEGTLVGLAAAYRNVDRVGDVIAPGAFTKTLADTGGRVPLLYQHDLSRPIGVCELNDSPAGLVVKARLALGVHDAQQAWALLKAGVIKNFSIGYDTVRSSRRADGVRVLEELTLWEVSAVTIPANPLATVTAMKANTVTRDLEQFPGAVSALALNVELSTLAATARELTARRK